MSSTHSAHVSAITAATGDAAWRPSVPCGHTDYTWGRLGQNPEGAVTRRTLQPKKTKAQPKEKTAPAAASSSSSSSSSSAVASGDKKPKAEKKVKESSAPLIPSPPLGPPIVLGDAALEPTGPILPVKDRRNILITSALPYVNNVPHLGNIIGCVLSADVYARFCRARGHNTIYICGTDEYGTATERKALEENTTPQAICDKYHVLHKEIYEWFNIGFDQFGRTTTPQQTEIAQDIFLQLEKNGWSTVKPTRELYCDAHKKFLADRFVEGTCPKCQYEDARGDQCDKCGSTLDAIDLIRPACKLCKESAEKDAAYVMAAPRVVESNHIFLDLEKLQPELSEWIKKASVKGEWSDNAIQITMGQLNNGLQSRPITKDLKWGTPVPKAGFEQKVFYVWFDAPIGYISITATYTKDWKQWWRNPDNVELVQFMGKDNIPFHTVMFPASLMAAAKDYTLLHHVSCTEYLQYEGAKFSKSRGTGVFGDSVKDPSVNIPSEVWRYYLLYNRPEQADAVFLWEDFASKVNTELANNLGNFINRNVSFLWSKGGNVVPPCGQLTDLDRQMIADVSTLKATYIDQLEHVKIKDGLKTVMAVSQRANLYMQDSKPWESFAVDRARADTVLFLNIQLISTLSVLLEPYMPSLSEKINAQLNQKQLPRGALDARNPESRQFTFQIPSGHVLGLDPKPLFRRIDDNEVAALRLKFGGKPAEKQKGEPFPVKIVIGTIVEAKEHEGAPHLFVLQVQTDEPPAADEKEKLLRPGFRQIVAGLRPAYESADLLGKKVALIVNLKYSNFKSVRSEGFLPTAVKGKTLAVLTIGGEVPNGSLVVPRDCIGQYKAAFDVKSELKKMDLVTRGDTGVVCFGNAPLQVEVKPGTVVELVGEKSGEGAKIQ